MVKRSSASSLPERQRRASDAATRANIVTYEFDPDNPPELAASQKADLEALDAMSDDDIDYSDIPPLDEKFWQNAVRNPFMRPIKQQLTLRPDADVIAWFKRRAQGQRGYQTAINSALRDFVERQEKKAG